VRRRFIQALGLATAAVPILEKRWRSEDDPTVRYWLAVALGWIGGRRAVQVLRRLEPIEPEPFVQSGIDEALAFAATTNSVK